MPETENTSGFLSPKYDSYSKADYDSLIYAKTNLGGYFFDAFLSTQCTRTLEITKHQVETGASISDHAYVNPVALNMSVLVSDVHRSIIPGQFEENDSRSRSAWNILKGLQDNRIPVSVMTKFGLFENMLIQSLSSSDKPEDIHNMRCDIILQELPVVRIKTVKISIDPQTTDSTTLGSQNAERVDNSIFYSAAGGSLDDKKSLFGGFGNSLGG